MNPANNLGVPTKGQGSTHQEDRPEWRQKNSQLVQAVFTKLVKDVIEKLLAAVPPDAQATLATQRPSLTLNAATKIICKSPRTRSSVGGISEDESATSPSHSRPSREAHCYPRARISNDEPRRSWTSLNERDLPVDSNGQPMALAAPGQLLMALTTSIASALETSDHRS